ncbi:MAG: hypothetical protein AABY22_25735 [Nanoarchaeota archaeon]
MTRQVGTLGLEFEESLTERDIEIKFIEEQTSKILRNLPINFWKKFNQKIGDKMQELEGILRSALEEYYTKLKNKQLSQHEFCKLKREYINFMDYLKKENYELEQEHHDLYGRLYNCYFGVKR